ncbi:hypothetical protein OAV66_05760 [Planktomarina temperata]|nr:hypothetical protein [Planktomarina temperata]
MALQLRRGTNAERAAETFAVGELIYTTDTKQIYVGDGSTQGGVLVSSSAASSPASLTQNLSLNGFNISGTGNISATAFVGDGSGLTGIAGGAGIEEGQEYVIDIQGNVRGDDTTVLVDAALGRVSADHYGDGSNLTGITINQLADVDTTGVTTDSVLKYDGAEWVIGADNNSGGGGGAGVSAGETYVINIQGDVIAEDSTVVFDAANNTLDNLVSVTATSLEGNLTGDVTGSVFGDDSTVLVDGVNNGLNAFRASMDFLATRYIEPADGFTSVTFRPVEGGTSNAINVNSEDAAGVINVKQLSDNDLSGNTGTLGVLNFIRDDSNGATTFGAVNVTKDFMQIVHDTAGVYTASKSIFNKDGLIGLGTNAPAAKLDIQGEIKVGSLTTTERNALTGANGMMLYNSTDSVFQVYENGAWVAMRDGTGGGGGGGASSFTNIGISADDSTIRLINEGESVGILGGTAITTASDAEGNITITGVAQDFTWASITSTPTTLSGYGITDAATSAQGALAASALQPANLGNFTFTNSILDSSDSSAITITPSVVVSSDLTVENDLIVTNTVTADRFVSTGTETPEISASANLNLTAGNAVVVTNSPLRMASFTTTERNALAAQNGDIVYNTTDNKFQGYENGAWANLI